MYYAGIGSRETPGAVCARMQQYGWQFAKHGFTLRSGRAIGADSAFELGRDSALMGELARKEIYTADDAKRNPHWLEHAALFHPAWEKCSPYAKLLHGRNSAVILGPYLNGPVDFVLCWTKDGKATGGTGQALRVAASKNIPVFNLFDADCEQRLQRWLGEAMR